LNYPHCGCARSTFYPALLRFVGFILRVFFKALFADETAWNIDNRDRFRPTLAPVKRPLAGKAQFQNLFAD